MISRTKIDPVLCWLIGWSHVAHAAVPILSFGLLTTRSPLCSAMWTARIDSLRPARQSKETSR